MGNLSSKRQPQISAFQVLKGEIAFEAYILHLELSQKYFVAMRFIQDCLWFGFMHEVQYYSISNLE